MKRNKWVQIHLVLVGLFFPLMIIMPLSGTAYLLGNKGTVTQTDAFTVDLAFTKDAEAIRKVIKEQDLDFDFEYVKDRGSHVILRPSTRTHYEVHPAPTGGMLFKKVEPSWIKILQELHFGHGPKLIKNIQIFFGIAFFLVILSGFILTLGLKAMRPLFYLSVAVGTVIFLLPFLF
jgi:hypothetical protein